MVFRCWHSFLVSQLQLVAFAGKKNILVNDMKSTLLLIKDLCKSEKTVKVLKWLHLRRLLYLVPTIVLNTVQSTQLGPRTAKGSTSRLLYIEIKIKITRQEVSTIARSLLFHSSSLLHIPATVVSSLYLRLLLRRLIDIMRQYFNDKQGKYGAFCTAIYKLLVGCSMQI